MKKEKPFKFHIGEFPGDVDFEEVKPVITKKLLRQWIIGAYCKSTGMDKEITLKGSVKAFEFADEVMQFLTDYKLLDKNIQP